MNQDTEKLLTDAIINLGVGMENLQKEMQGMRLAQEETNHRLDKLEKQQVKTNLALGEMRLSYMKMSDAVSGLRSDVNGLQSNFKGLRADFNRYAESNNALVKNHETRLVRLEEKTSGNSYIASEPSVHYKRKKRK